MKRKQAENDGAFTVVCPKCRAPVGQACRNYRGQNKQTCGERIYAEIRQQNEQAAEPEQGYLFPPDPQTGAGSGQKL